MHSRYRRDSEDLLKRLRKVEGQIRGIQKMVEQDRYCVDILNQISAAKAALDRVGLIILEDHTRGCVAEAMKTEDEARKIDELMLVIKKFVD